MERAFKRFSGVSTALVFSLGDGFAREQERLREMLPHEIEIMRHDKHGALFLVPAGDEVKKIGDGFGVDGRKWFVKQNEARHFA